MIPLPHPPESPPRLCSTHRAAPWLLALALLLVAGLVLAQQLKPVPALTARVIDQTGTLSATQRAALEDKLAALEQDKGSQVVLLMVPTTQPEDIAAYSHRVADDWKIGRREVGDGLLVVVAQDDRRMRIEVARALEGAVPDIAAGRIINDVMAPFFRRGDYAGGLDAAVEQLAARIRGEPLPPVSTSAGLPGPDDDPMETLVILFIVFVFLSIVTQDFLARRTGALVTAGGVGMMAWVMTASLLLALFWGVVAFAFALFRGGGPTVGPGSGGGPVHLPRNGGFGGGFGGGGFGSGGGGSFGGGGASGSW